VEGDRQERSHSGVSNLTGEELAIVAEMLESERARLLVEIRHTGRRAFRDELRPS
jgi:hypothetical protein